LSSSFSCFFSWLASAGHSSVNQIQFFTDGGLLRISRGSTKNKLSYLDAFNGKHHTVSSAAKYKIHSLLPSFYVAENQLIFQQNIALTLCLIIKFE
jgi:hypothetical protein